MVFFEENDDKLGFPQGWINLIMSCVTTPFFQSVSMVRHLIISDLLGGFAKVICYPPYLFLICAEVFTSLLAREEENGWLHKIKVFVWRACHNILPTFERLW